MKYLRCPKKILPNLSLIAIAKRNCRKEISDYTLNPTSFAKEFMDKRLLI
jgi:hypothetical protein